MELQAQDWLYLYTGLGHLVLLGWENIRQFYLKHFVSSEKNRTFISFTWS